MRGAAGAPGQLDRGLVASVPELAKKTPDPLGAAGERQQPLGERDRRLAT